MISTKRQQWRSLAGGELSPEMFGRVDLPRAAIGLKRCYNAFISPQGALFNRAGSRFITQTKDNLPAWLETFVRPDGQGFLLEFTDECARIVLAGNVVGENTAVTLEALDSVTLTGTAPVLLELTGHSYAPGDEIVLQGMTLANPDAAGTHLLMGYLNRSWYVFTTPSVDTFTIGSYWPPESGDDGVAWEALAESPYDGLVLGGSVDLAANVDAIELVTPYPRAQLRASSVAQSVNKFYMTHQSYPPQTLSRGGDNFWQFYAAPINAILSAPSNLVATPVGTAGASPITYTYTATIRSSLGIESAIATPDTAINTLRTIGNHNDISWDSLSPTPFLYEVYKNVGGSVFGWIGSSDGLTFTDDNIEPDYTRQPPEELTGFDSANNYPRTICFYEQRSIYAGTRAAPQSFWASNLGAADYFQASYPPQNDQAFTYELNSLRASPVLHSIALRDLLFFTGSGVFRVFSTGESFAPVTAASIPVVSVGAHEAARPQASGAYVLFPAARGGYINELKYDDSAAGYSADDVSIIAAHLIDGHTWVQTAFQHSPYPVWYGLRSDGIIIGLTYMPSQQVYAWWQFELPGAVIESITVVPEGNNDVLYVATQRTIDGAEVHYIERVEARLTGASAADITQAYFLDCGGTYDGAATGTLTGLDHLEGEDLTVLADGRVLGPYTVSSGQITLDAEAELIQWGIPYQAEVETLPLAYLGEEGAGMGVTKNVSQVWLRLKESLGVKAGTSFADIDLTELQPAIDDLIGDVPDLRNGVYSIDIQPSWADDVTICLKQAEPLPLCITGLVADYADGG